MEACGGLAVPPLEKSSCVSPVTPHDASGEKNSEGKRRMVIRIPVRSKKADDNDGSTAQINPSPAEKDEEKKKEPWKLRPRKDARPWQRASERKMGNETKSKKETPEKIRKLPVALSRVEIEEDLAFLTGGNRPRTTLKRPRSVYQRKDDLFPGAHLGSITIKSYSIH